MNPCIASDESTDKGLLEAATRLTWNSPRMRRQPARDAKADHGELHFDNVGFS